MHRLFVLFLTFMTALSLRAQGQIQVTRPQEDASRTVPAEEGALLVLSSASGDLTVSSPELRQKATKSRADDGKYNYTLPLNWNDEYDDMSASVSVLSPKGSASFQMDLQRGKVYVAIITVGSTFLILDEAYSKRKPGLLPMSGRSAVVINSSAEELSVFCDEVLLYKGGQPQPLPEGGPVVRLGRAKSEQIWCDTIYFDLSSRTDLQPVFRVSLGESELSFQLPATMGVKRVYRYMVIAIDQSESHSAFLHITSAPSGADVIYQGSVVGKTPHDLFVQGKTATITLQLNNYHEALINVPLRKDKEKIPLHADLNPMFGTLTCTSVPAGAVTYLDGERLGATPLSRTILSGSYTLSIVRELYDTWTRTITIEDGKALEVSADMVQACAEVQIQSLPHAAIYIDRTFTGRSDVTRTLAEGSHLLRASLNGYEPVEMTINVVRNQPLSVQLMPTRNGIGATAPVSAQLPTISEGSAAASSQASSASSGSSAEESHVSQSSNPTQSASKTKENPYETFNRLNAEAERGDAQAQCLTGLCYFKGEGIMRSLPSAYYYFALSAQQGYADGQYWLAYCLQNGYGTAVDIEKAREYYQKAAAQGHEKAAQALRQLSS